ncbi:HsdM family class I SAM-dependent methyltransferase [Yoonia sp. 208BN28-4]|uniref:HsdM family class I SAM-dependent methyltransferase n=1 Tax=Yoonia sp. 208BN28-4 TaxID=3126505 RepID=UPI00309A1658
MQTKFAAKRVGTLNKFFTKVSVGELLARHIPCDDPQTLIDLGAGEGSLSKAAVQRWPNISIVTVDLDPTTTLTLQESLHRVGCINHRHHQRDALTVDLSSGLIEEHGRFDVAVCNPPFFNPKWSRDHADVLQLGDLADACGSKAEVTAEVLFIAQSLALLKSGGRLAVVVPDSLITTSRAQKFRKSLLQNHTVETVIQLPLNSFHETDAQCFIIVLKKDGGPTQALTLLNADVDQNLSQPIQISGINAENRMDFNFHFLRCEKSDSHTTLRELGAEIFRGSISTVQRKVAEFPVFHTSDYKDIIDGEINLPELGSLTQSAKVVAEAGDILMARVDRNLHEKIGMVANGSAVLTDCVYRIRLPQQHRDLAYAALCSDKGRMNLKALTKGVGARIIGKADLLDMPLSGIET